MEFEMGSHRELVTDTNKSPLIQILSWMFLVIVVLSCAARTGTKLHMVKVLKTEDYMAIGATVAACIQYIINVVQGYAGLGKSKTELDDGQIERVLKGEYAANIFYIVSLLLAKITISMMIMTIAQRTHRRMIQAIEILIGAWAITGLAVVFFQCQLPSPWDYISSSCIQRFTFWTYFSAVNIATDIALLGIMVENVRRIQTTWGKKTLVICVFGSRVFVTPALICQIFYSSKGLSSSDPTFDMWELTVIMAVVQVTSILAICIPNLKPFLDSLESGQIRVDDLRRQGKSSSGGYNSYRNGYKNSGQNSAGHSNSRVLNSNRDRDPLASKASQRSKMFELVDIPKSRKDQSSANSTQKDLHQSDANVAWDGQSHTSQTILIQQTKTWHVDVETRNSSD